MPHTVQIHEPGLFIKIIRLVPLMLFSLIAYNLVVLYAGEPGADGGNPVFELLSGELFSIPMMTGGTWTFTLEHLFLAFGLLFLFFEIVKATNIGGAAIAEMAISTVVFIVFLVEFLLVAGCSTSVFFLLMMMSLIDVIGGYIIGIKVARRDLAIGGGVM